MKHPRLITSLVFLGAASVASLSLLGTGCVGMGQGKSSTQLAAGRASVPTPDIEELLSKMTLEEKVGQMTQVDWKLVKNTDDIRRRFIGAVLNGRRYPRTPRTKDPRDSSGLEATV